MGIRNPTRFYVIGLQDTAHNPAWGFVTQSRQRVVAQVSPHNPAWGFVTLRAESDKAWELWLITPHGDS